MFKHILALECNFTTGFCRFGVPRTFPPDQFLAKFGSGDYGGRGYQDWRIGGHENTYFTRFGGSRGLETLQITCFGGFGLAGVRFYDMFKHILALECNFTTGFCRFCVQRTFPPDQFFPEFGCGEGGLWREGLPGLEDQWIFGGIS